ncbi:MAG TPA: bifunctional diaminohydroxyphosphoribosylaminopyrimidine deaminase/5-amino-6-(5-phosphoribosylamino)uracil reductase RibD [Thermoanaerobaculales bacterium]|nr:bifunctional diaminohydroxyphosphoribosylaminopyrimidine deaminase/5-amino-6-(5-phosphoribosylamino)uracil reductase RibD [Thermoanaerobaculales bacterium]
MAGDNRDADARWMRRALELAARGRFGASPNPMVGAVVVDPDGRLVGEGYHARCGGPHAEVVALREAGERARGGSLFVTLEPCAHHGRTPPCVDAILSAGIRRVVAAMREPSPHAGGGLDRLRAEGVDAGVGGDSDRARALNRRWLTWVQERRPWVTLKAAVSLDGRIATRTGQSKWITGEAARRRSLELREEHDAVVVGVGTVLADDPQLTRRLGLNPGDTWTRVVLDSGLRTPTAAQVVWSSPEQTLIAHTPEAAPAERRRLEAAGVQLIEVAAANDGRVELHQLLEQLARRDVAALLVEGGSAVHGSFADAGLVDEAVFFVAPLLIGGSGPSAVGGRGVADLELASRLRFAGIARHGDDLELRAVRPEDEDVHGSG